MTYKIDPKTHLLTGVKQQLTKKYTANRIIVPKAIVFHYTCGWTTAGDVHTLAVADNKVSAHLVVGRDADVVQLVPFNRRAWHAGPSRYLNVSNDLNSDSIGIEISNIGYLTKLGNNLYRDFHGNTLNGKGHFINSTRKAKSAPEGWIETDNRKRLPTGRYVWEPYYPEQLAELEQIVAVLVKHYPTIKYGLTHEEIDTRKWKTDPGPAFPIDRFRQIIKDPRIVSAPSVPVAESETPKPTKVGWGKRLTGWLRWPL